MKTITLLIKQLTIPKHLNLTEQDGIAYWQEKVILNLLLAAVTLGLITYIPSFALAIVEDLKIIASVDTLLYIYILYLFFNKNLSYNFRATSICIISYILGIVLLSVLGPFGAGSVWLFCFPVITAILLRYKTVLWTLLINILTLAGIGLLIHQDMTDSSFSLWYLASENSLEKWIIISLNFILLNIITTLSVATVISGLKKSMASVSHSETRYRRIFENIQDVYFETTLDGAILEISPSVEKTSKYLQEELKKNSILDLYEDVSQREETIKILFDKGYVQDREIRLVDKNGEIRFCSVNCRLVKDETNSQKIIGVLRDISYQKAMEKEKKELEEKLNRASKMEAIGLLAGGVAHDLNNILSGVITYPELIAINLNDDDPIKKSLNIIQSSGNRAAQIIQDLLTLSRRGVITKDLINFNDLVVSFLETPEYKKILSYHPDIIVEKQINALSPYLKGSSIHLQKTLMNLISNAAEAQLDGGTICIKTENRHLDTPVKGYDNVEPGTYIVLCVKDSGTGIDPQDLQRIFEPFFTKKVMGRSGTGLGMAVVWGAVQDHDGYIDIISGHDKGTTFELYFPISDEQTEPENQKISIDTYKGNGEKIVIVDDIKEQRQIASETLEKLGYKTVSIANGEDTVEYLKKNSADLLILDMIMEPGIDGLETYRQILDFKPEQKAIIASGFSKTFQVKQTLELGAGQYLNKPYTIEKLGLAVKAELAKKKKR
jgi:two-component system, cell cycle sensor histidine kinase and response regulator CckA